MKAKEKHAAGVWSESFWTWKDAMNAIFFSAAESDSWKRTEYSFFPKMTRRDGNFIQDLAQLWHFLHFTPPQFCDKKIWSQVSTSFSCWSFFHCPRIESPESRRIKRGRSIYGKRNYPNFNGVDTPLHPSVLQLHIYFFYILDVDCRQQVAPGARYRFHWSVMGCFSSLVVPCKIQALALFIHWSGRETNVVSWHTEALLWHPSLNP